VSQFDVTLDGNQFRLLRGGDSKPYKRGWQRRELDDPIVRPSTRQAMASRGDRPLFYQTSWAGGSNWWKPLYGPGNSDTYGDSTNFDTFSKPGTVIPRSKSTAVSTGMSISAPTFSVAGALYTIGTTQTEDSTYQDVYKWTPASDDWIRETGYSSGIATEVPMWGGIHDATTGYTYLMSPTKVSRFDMVSAQDNEMIAVDATYGDNLMQTADGKIWVYDDGILKELNDPGGTETWVTRSDDGFGPDVIAGMATPASQLVFANQLRLAVAGSGGVFVAKNSFTTGKPQAILARVERDQSGAYIRYPLTTLPEGVLVLNVTVHLGSVIMATTQDWQLAMANDASKTEVPRVDFWHYTDGGGLGVVGAPDREKPTEYIVSFLGALGHHLLIGSQSRVWVYDARNGGIHPWLDLTNASEGVFVGASVVVDSSGNTQLLVKEDASSSVHNLMTDDSTTVTTLGDDLTTYVLTSNYIDFNRPFEDKILTAIRVQSELLTANQEYTIQISIDDGTFTTRAQHTGAVTFSETDVASAASPLTGKRFRYRIIYQSTDATIQGLQGIELVANGGEMVPWYEFTLDAGEIRSVENVPQDPETVYDNLETSAAKEVPVAVIDNFRSQRTEDTSTVNMKIAELQIVKDADSEGIITIRLMGL